jgi:hypothetical protein
MESWTLAERWRKGTLWAAGLGALASGIELVGLAASDALPLGFVEVLLLGLIGALAMGALASLVAGVLGVVHAWRADAPAHRNLALQLGLTASVLALFYLAPFADVLVREERYIPAAAMLGMAVALGGGVLFNARYWLARAELGNPSPVGWLPVAAAGTAVVVGIAAGLWSQRDTGGGYALEGDPNVLLVTVDGTLPDGAAMGALAEAGARFDRAVVPSDSSLAVNASFLTGLHPIRHRAIAERYRLPRGMPTVARTLEAEGWATAAFVSSVAVAAHTRLDQGFRVYEDTVAGGVRGIRRLRLPSWIVGAGRVVRPPGETLDHVETWMRAHADVPWFAWVHVVDPSDADLARLGAMVADIGATDRTLVVVAGAAGPDAGAPFSNARIRRPLVLVAPGKPKELGVVEAQVRPWDVAQTLVVYAGLDAMPQSEGVELLSYLTGRRKLSMWLSMLARDGEDWLQGVRTDEVAYIFERATEDEVLYDLTSDPDQQVDLSAEQTEAVAKARGLLSGDRTALDERLAEGPVADRLIDARLAALGYR